MSNATEAFNSGESVYATRETRGIGKAISLALKAVGYLIAANYTENDEAAVKFKVVNGICKRGFRRVVNISSINEQKG